MKKTFDGMYYKHQKGEDTVSLIAGVSSGDHAFIQIITNKASHYVRYPLMDYRPGKTLIIGDSVFSKKGVSIHIERGGVSVAGKIRYTGLTPVEREELLQAVRGLWHFRRR